MLRLRSATKVEVEVKVEVVNMKQNSPGRFSFNLSGVEKKFHLGAWKWW